MLKGQVHSNPFFRPHLGQCLLDPRLVALHHLQEGCYLFNCLSLEISANICSGLSRQSTPHPFDLEWLHQGSDLHLAHLLAGHRCILQRLFQGIKINDSLTSFYTHSCFSSFNISIYSGLVSPLLASALLQVLIVQIENSPLPLIYTNC